MTHCHIVVLIAECIPLEKQHFAIQYGYLLAQLIGAKTIANIARNNLFSVYSNSYVKITSMYDE